VTAMIALILSARVHLVSSTDDVLLEFGSALDDRRRRFAWRMDRSASSRVPLG
jgi:hypothetical protein